MAAAQEICEQGELTLLELPASVRYQHRMSTLPEKSYFSRVGYDRVRNLGVHQARSRVTHTARE